VKAGGPEKKRSAHLVVEECVEKAWATVKLLSHFMPEAPGVCIDDIGDFLKARQGATDSTGLRYVLDSSAVKTTSWSNPTIATALSKAVDAGLLQVTLVDGTNMFAYTHAKNFDLWTVQNTSIPHHNAWREPFLLRENK